MWADLMAAMACTLANSVDKTEPRYTAREKEYAECIKRLGGKITFYFDFEKGDYKCQNS